MATKRIRWKVSKVGRKVGTLEEYAGGSRNLAFWIDRGWVELIHVTTAVQVEEFDQELADQEPTPGPLSTTNFPVK